MLSNLLDISRIVIVCATFFFGYQIGFDGDVYQPQAQLHFMIPLVILAISGLSGIEGLLFGKSSAEAKGYETGSNYQIQSSIALLSYAVVAVLVYFLNWGIKAELTILFTFLFFFFFSGLNHGLDAIKRRNYKWQNINRPFIVVMLIGGLVYPVIMVFAEL
jgi:FlaA1/EpsC-like NDP-sugar epimerase